MILRSGYTCQSRNEFRGMKEADSKEKKGRGWKRLKFN
jgi:hypothetical protein